MTEELVELVMAEHMATSMKLLAVRAIDSLLDYPQGIESFLGWSRKVSVCESCSNICVT